MKTNASKMSIDEAKKRKGKLGMSDEEFEKIVAEKQDEQFKYLRSLVFSWQEQEDGPPKFLSRLPNGKICFLDWSDDPNKVKENVPYICAVYERETDAFAKIICEEYQPKIVVFPSKMVNMIWKDEKGNTRHRMVGPYDSFEERIVDAVKSFMKLGVSEAQIQFIENQN